MRTLNDDILHRSYMYIRFYITPRRRSINMLSTCQTFRVITVIFSRYAIIVQRQFLYIYIREEGYCWTGAITAETTSELRLVHHRYKRH